MPLSVSRMVCSICTSARVVTSPITHRKPFVTAVSQATRAAGPCASIASRIASETWSQTLSGWPSVTDSEVSRYEPAVVKEVMEPVAIVQATPAAPGPSARDLLLVLAQEPGLEGEDVVQHAVDPPAFEAVVRDQAARPQQVAQAVGQRSVDPHL